MYGEGVRMQDDARLVLRCLKGDTEAYSDLIRRYQGAVYATAFYYAGRYGAAEDVAQESFMAAYRSLPWLKETEKFGPWLRGITCRTAANWLRRHQRQLTMETPLPYRRPINIEDVHEGPGATLERDERFERVQNAIDGLPERYRLPVILRYLQELSYDEISAFTGESRDETRGVLQRAGRQLREALSDINADDGDVNWRPVSK